MRNVKGKRKKKIFEFSNFSIFQVLKYFFLVKRKGRSGFYLKIFFNLYVFFSLEFFFILSKNFILLSENFFFLCFNLFSFFCIFLHVSPSIRFINTFVVLIKIKCVWTYFSKPKYEANILAFYNFDWDLKSPKDQSFIPESLDWPLRTKTF